MRIADYCSSVIQDSVHVLVFSLNIYSFQRLNYAHLRLLHVNRVNVSLIYLFVALLLRYFYHIWRKRWKHNFCIFT